MSQKYAWNEIESRRRSSSSRSSFWPGEITDSNADAVDGKTAEWHESGPEAFGDNRIYATSTVPISASVPGFGLSITALALLGGALYLSKRSD